MLTLRRSAVYWEGDKSVWGKGYVKVRSFNVKGGNVSYGAWSSVMKIN